MRIVAIALLALLGACNHFNPVRYANFDLACAMPAPTESDQIPVLREMDMAPTLPVMVAFAHINGDFHGGSEASKAYNLRSAAWGRAMRPDLIVFRDQGSAYAGSMTQYLGFGMAMSTPVSRPQAVGYCMRLAPCIVGYVPDSTGMIVGLSDTAREAGMQEGDKVLSINGHAVEAPPGGMAPWHAESLQMKVGDEVDVVWIRPGAGRMQGKVKMQPNRVLSPSIPSLVQWHFGRKKEVASKAPPANRNVSPGDAWQQ